MTAKSQRSRITCHDFCHQVPTACPPGARRCSILGTDPQPGTYTCHLIKGQFIGGGGGGRGIGKKYTDWLSVLQKTNLLTRKLRSKELVSRESQRKKSAWKEEEEEKGTENQLQQQEHVALQVRTGSRGHRRRREGERHAPWRFARNTLETTGDPLSVWTQPPMPHGSCRTGPSR